MPVICGACWALGAREGYFVATVTAFLTAVPALHAPPELPPALLALRVAVPVAAFLFIAAAVTSFRRSYDRESFNAHRDRMTGTLNKEVFHRPVPQAIADVGHNPRPPLTVLPAPIGRTRR